MILNAILILGELGILFGAILAIAAKCFHVEKDGRVEMILEVLPNANCGGCGFSGCAAFANAVVAGDADTSACSVGGAEVAQKVAQIMGKDEAVPAIDEKIVAKVCCSGQVCQKSLHVDESALKAAGIVINDVQTDVAKTKYAYDGIVDCVAANNLLGGAKICPYSCLGYGTCVRACPFGAIEVKHGVASIDPEKCTACGKCIAVCPKNVISFDVANTETAFVKCNSHNKGQVVRQICDVGCIGCKICEKTCKYGAITVDEDLAVVDPSKCTGCRECVAKCPRKIIE